MAKRFDNKVLLVTGAARGIGATVARGFVARGGRVALLGLEPDLLKALAEELGNEAAWWEADVRNAAQMTEAVDSAAAHFGQLDYVLANAGIASYGTVRQIDDAGFSRVIDININGVYRTLHAAVPHLIATKGHTLVVASLASFTAVMGLAPYAASKAGAESLGIAFRQEMAPFGVGVGVVHPGWIDTDLVRNAEADLPTFRHLRSKVMPWPANSTTTVEECADAILRGFAKRSGRVYVPRPVGLVNYFKPIINSAVMWPLVKQFTSKYVAPMEADVDKLGGRSRGGHTPD